MRTIYVADGDIPDYFGRYQRHVIWEGHRPGVLSGAEIGGEAARYGSRYSHSRANVVLWARHVHDVRSALVPHPDPKQNCHVRVWTDGAGRLVEFRLKPAVA